MIDIRTAMCICIRIYNILYNDIICIQYAVDKYLDCLIEVGISLFHANDSFKRSAQGVHMLWRWEGLQVWNRKMKRYWLSLLHDHYILYSYYSISVSSQILKSYLQTKPYPPGVGTFENDVPFPKVGMLGPWRVLVAIFKGLCQLFVKLDQVASAKAATSPVKALVAQLLHPRSFLPFPNQ